MNAYKMQQCAAGRLILVTLGAWLVLFPGTAGAVEEKFDVLQVGTQTYSNVTVTTKAKSYVFILHSQGMTSLRPAALPPEVQEQLGYAPGGGPKPATNTASAWAKREIAKINVPKVEDLQQQINEKINSKPPPALAAIGLIGPRLIVAVLGVFLLFYLFGCYCWMLICRKTGNPGGILVWLPGLQIFPVLRAAGMSAWWVLAYFVPVLNVIAYVLLCFNIAKARGKSAWVGLFLLLPITSLFAFLYLAFSNGGRTEEDEEPETRIMTLEAA
jgi:hypothetical protein